MARSLLEAGVPAAERICIWGRGGGDREGGFSEAPAFGGAWLSLIQGQVAVGLIGVDLPI
jgi:hypothetical protein